VFTSFSREIGFMISHNPPHTIKPLKAQLNNTHKKIDSKMVFLERFLSLQLSTRVLKKLSLWRSPHLLLSLFQTLKSRMKI
jgi:heme oxygenase